MANLYQEQAPLEAHSKHAQKLLSKQQKPAKLTNTRQKRANKSAQRKGLRDRLYW